MYFLSRSLLLAGNNYLVSYSNEDVTFVQVSGLPIRNNDRHVGEIASMALELLNAVKSHKISHRPNETLKLRVGIHTGKSDGKLPAGEPVIGELPQQIAMGIATNGDHFDFLNAVQIVCNMKRGNFLRKI